MSSDRSVSRANSLFRNNMSCTGKEVFTHLPCRNRDKWLAAASTKMHAKATTQPRRLKAAGAAIIPTPRTPFRKSSKIVRTLCICVCWWQGLNQARKKLDQRCPFPVKNTAIRDQGACNHTNWPNDSRRQGLSESRADQA